MATPAPSLLEIALRHIADSSPDVAVTNLRKLDDPCVEELAVLAFAQIMRTRFSAARGPARQALVFSQDQGPDAAAVALAVNALVVAFIGPDERTSLDDISLTMRSAKAAIDMLDAPTDLHRYLMVEASMSGGEIAQAIALSSTGGRPEHPVLGALLGQARARALAFGGLLDDAQAEAEVTLDLAREHGLQAMESLVLGLCAYLAAQRGDRAELRAAARAALALAHTPASSYFHAGAHILVAYALAADAQYPLAAAALLSGGGSDLTRMQFVDRAYGYELLAGAALQSDDVLAASHWLTQAQALPSEGMAGAAVARTEAMVRAAEGELPAGALAAVRAVQHADRKGGSLDAARARVLHGSALSRIGSRQKALEELERVTVSATELGALRIRAQAVREMRRLGRRVPPAGRDRHHLSPREKQVALLVADGLSNRQVARLLSMSERTVQSHLVTILRRLGLTSRAALPQALGVQAPETAAVELTDRQRAVTELVARGLSNAAIAGELGVSPKTVEKHLGDAFARTGATSRTALAAYWQATAS